MTNVVTDNEEIVLSIVLGEKFIVYLPKKRIKKNFFHISL